MDCNKQVNKGGSMKRGFGIGLVILAFLTLALATNSYSASHTFKYTETYKDKVITMWYGYDVMGIGKISINASILLDINTFNAINGETLLGIYFEDFIFEEQFKNAIINGGYFDPVKKKARFIIAGPYYDYFNDLEKNIQYMIVDVKCSKTKMTIKVTCYTSPYDIQFPLMAGYYIGDFVSRSLAEDQEFVDAFITIGDLNVEFLDMLVTGSLKYKITKKKFDLFDTWTISAKAAGIGTTVLE
jgi:hypothetical protein